MHPYFLEGNKYAYIFLKNGITTSVLFCNLYFLKIAMFCYKLYISIVERLEYKKEEDTIHCVATSQR